MLKRKYYIFFLIIYFAIILNNAAVYAETEEKDKTMVMVIIDRINIEDLDVGLPNINNLLQNGSCALMNVRTASSRYDTASSYLTIGTGTRAYAAKEAELILNAREKYEGYEAGELFTSISGIETEQGNMLVMNLQKLIENNEKLNQEVTLGFLGDKLKNNGIAVTVLGSADGIQEKSRLSGLIAMDKEGIVDLGIIDKSLIIQDKYFPYLLRTEYEELYLNFLNHSQRKGLIIIELGDTLRLDRQYNNISREKLVNLRKEALRKADDFIGKLITKMDFEKDLLMVLTPSPSSIGYKEGDLLTPFIIYGNGYRKGYVFSATTRRPGLVTNLDIAPTILDYFKITQANNFLGSTLIGIPNVNSFAALRKINKEIIQTYNQRALIIKPFVAYQIILSLFFLVFLIFRRQWLKYLKPLILGSISIPFILLILPLISLSSLGQKYFWIIFLAVIFSWTLSLGKSSLKSVVLISLATAAGILLDLLYGAPLMKVSILGYDPIGGSRYYGLGNEYMGILVGSLIIGLTAIFDTFKIEKRKEIILAVLFLFTFYLIISPAFGSNVGGGISSLGAFLLTFFLIKNQKLKFKHFFYLGLILGVLLIVIFIIIIPHNPPSHISKTLDIIKARGFSSLFIILKRKLLMNLKLLKYTVWTRALLTSFLMLAYLLYRPPYILKQIFSENSNLYKGFLGAGFGLILVLICNDSGIVASGTLMLFLALPAMLLVCEKEIMLKRKMISMQE